MLRRFSLAIILVWAAVASADVPVKLPPGTRAEGDHQVSGRGLRDTTDFLAKELDRRGIAADRLGPYSVHGVELSRFVSRSDGTPWLAIHVVRIAGKTLIYFVPRSGGLDESARTR
jgi:hypothetical protein